MNNKITYHQQVSYCGKPRCKKCREGSGHGPYWYAYQTIDGRTTRTYVGKTLPPEAQTALEGTQEAPPPSPIAVEQEHALVRIYVLGQFRLERRSSQLSSDWQTVTESAWQHQRVRALLGCLVSSPGRKLPREQIMDALWSDLDIDTASSRLDRAVYSLRQLFEPGRNRPATSPLLLTEREMLVLADQSQVWIDADAFEHLLTQARTSSDPGQVETLLEEAARLYGGDFLPEERRIEWTLARRESLQRSWIGLLLDLADQRAAREAHAGAIELLDRLLSIDPTNEAAVQRLIKLLAQLGRRGEALRAYKRLASVLQQEYRIAPLPETRALYDALRSGGSSGTGGTATAARPSGTLTSPTTPVRETPSPTARPQPARTETAPAVQVGRTHQSPLVGREEELTVLRTMVATAEQAARFRLSVQKRSIASPLDTQRRPQCVLLMGEVGIGKTRLAEEVSREAKKNGWAIAWSRVYAQEGSIPYRLWTEVLRKAMSQGAWQRQEISRRAAFFQPLSTLLPELQEYLPPLNYASSLSHEQEQLRLWEAARELLTLISENTPLLIALDDLQWSDGSSCELLAYLARRVQNHPIIIVGTCRDRELAANHPLRPLLTDLQREHAVQTVPLQPLSNEQINALVSHVPHLPGPIVQRISKRAAGNPFFAEELARTLSAQFATSSLNGAFDNQPVTSNNANTGEETLLPDTITAVLDLRLGRLSPACRSLLNKASVLGSSFEFQVINAMEASTPNSNEDVVLELLEEALKSGMLTEEGTGTRITYQFWHPLLASHLYEKLSAARRASLHRRAADIFLHTYQGREEEGAATITYHLLRGGSDQEQIAHYAELAGNRDYALSAYREAERHYRTALDHLADIPENQLHRAYLLEILGECTRVQGKYEDARRYYEQAIQRRNMSLAPTIDKQEEAELQAMLWCEIGLTWFEVGKNGKALECYERGEQVLKDAGVLAGPAWARSRYEKGYVYWREGNYTEANRTANEALTLFEDALRQSKQRREKESYATRVRRTLVGDPVDIGRAYHLLGVIASAAGQSGEALRYYTTALASYEQYDRQREIGIICGELGDLYLRRAEYENAHAALRRARIITESVGDIPVLSLALGNLGILAARTGDLIEAESFYKQCIALDEQTNYQVALNWFLIYLAITLQDMYKLNEAREVLRRALAISRSMHIAPCIGAALTVVGSLRLTQVTMLVVDEENPEQNAPEVIRTLKKARVSIQHALALESIEAETRTEGQLLLAQVMLLQGELDEAEQQAMSTLEEARKYELKWLIARTQRVLGCIFSARGQQGQAEQLFKQAISDFRKYGMRLEYARTLQSYGEMLLKRDGEGSRDFGRGLEALQEARRIFEDCGARLDLQVVERVLAKYGQMAGRSIGGAGSK